MASTHHLKIFTSPEFLEILMNPPPRLYQASGFGGANNYNKMEKGIHPTIEGLEIWFGKIYSYTNKVGHINYIIPVKATNKKIFVTWKDGSGEHPIGITKFKQFNLSQ